MSQRSSSDTFPTLPTPTPKPTPVKCQPNLTVREEIFPQRPSQRCSIRSLSALVPLHTEPSLPSLPPIREPDNNGSLGGETLLTWGISGAFPCCILHIRGMLCGATAHLIVAVLKKLEDFEIQELILEVSELYWLDEEGLELWLHCLRRSRFKNFDLSILGLDEQPLMMLESMTLANHSSDYEDYLVLLHECVL